MSKKDRIFLVAFIVLFMGYLVVEYTAPKPINWQVTFYEKDKNPFGGYVLHERMNDLFTSSKTTFSHLTLLDSGQQQSILILAESTDLSPTDQEWLKNALEDGRSVFIASHSLPSHWLDSLGLELSYQFSPMEINALTTEKISLHHLSDSTEANYPVALISSHFSFKKDSTATKKEKKQLENTWDVIATDDKNNPILLNRYVGEGKLILCSTPLLFTNFGLLYDDNYTFAQKLLTELPEGPVTQSYYYQLGPNEAQTPLRYVLSQPALKWALYLTLVAVLILLVINSRRKQRAIPVINPPENTTVEYAMTLGNLYFQEGNHTGLARKMMQHFVSQVKEKYALIFEDSERFYQQLALRSKVSQKEIEQTCAQLLQIRSGRSINGNELIQLAEKLNRIL